MKQKFSLVIIALILIVPMVLYSAFKTPAKSGALEAATGRPIVLEFSSPLCSECQKLRKMLVFTEPKFASKVTFQKFDSSTMDMMTTQQFQKYDVKVVPTTIFINRNGEIVTRKEGAMTKEEFISNINELLK